MIKVGSSQPCFHPVDLSGQTSWLCSDRLTFFWALPHDGDEILLIISLTNKYLERFMRLKVLLFEEFIGDPDGLELPCWANYLLLEL